MYLHDTGWREVMLERHELEVRQRSARARHQVAVSGRCCDGAPQQTRQVVCPAIDGLAVRTGVLCDVHLLDSQLGDNPATLDDGSSGTRAGKGLPYEHALECMQARA